MRHVAIAFAALTATLATSAAGQERRTAPDLELWRLDCGEIHVSNLDVFSDAYLYVGREKTLTDSCYLIRHGERYLLWDTGLPAEAAAAPQGEGPFRMTLRATLREQLRRIDVRPEQVSFVGISHYHDDHTGQAADFPRATLLIGSEDWTAIGERPDAAARFQPWIAGTSRVEQIGRDRDVFGDGSVVMLDLPGHTPGHHALLVRLPRAGPVLLTGDLFHFHENMTNRGVPSFNTDRSDTLASYDRFMQIARSLGATIIIQHEPADIGKLPAFPGIGAVKNALLALTLAFSSVSAAAAQTSDPWRVLAERDVEAAHRILQEDHPATTPEAGDTGFRQRLAAAYAQARGRAARVTSFEGLAATLAGFATALGDKHIRARAILNLPTLDWAGLLVVRRGGDWVVADEERQEGEPSLLRAELARCDGVSADRLAEQRLGGFRAIWTVPAQQVAVAPLLLVDDGNPFLTRPARCTFVLEGEQREATLRWRTIGRAAIAPRINAIVNAGAPGLGVRQSGAGWWIALQSLSDQAIPVVEAVRARAEEMRRGAFVVVDMRGNGGGNSIYGDQIAEALLGPAAASGNRGESESCSPVWRVSPRNLATLAAVAQGAVERMGQDAALFWRRQQERALAARAAGRPLSGPADCGVRSAPADEARTLPGGSLVTGKLVVLTDHLCFSSCLLVTDRLRNLGALHVGATTDAATRYFEVREDRLPSGVMAFSTLQALAPASPYQIGPFTPDRIYDGDISDTGMLERWVGELAVAAVR